MSLCIRDVTATGLSRCCCKTVSLHKRLKALFEALEKAREEGNLRHYQHKDNPRCPHCGEIYKVIEHEAYDLYNPNGDIHEIECGNCEKEFAVTIHTIFSFSTDDADEYE